MSGSTGPVFLGAAAAVIAGCTVQTLISDDGGEDPGAIDAVVADAGHDAGPPGCPVEFIECATGCTRVAEDALNCGSCGNICPPGVTCAAGRCNCVEPMLACEGVCLDPSADPMNCGACGNACAPSEMCSAGECIVMCYAPDLICVNRDADGTQRQVCSNLTDDPLNCGTCNTRCTGGSECIAGRCQCPGSQLICRGACVDVSSDVANCGSCGISCGADGTCAGSRCTVCGTGLTDCTGRCVDVSSDRFNCGTCGRGCGSGESCIGGLCDCAAGYVDCGSGCIDPGTDERNCGGCGTSCGPSGVCSGGTCTCASGFTMCGASCSDLSRDEANCGTCGYACGAAEACDGGTCSPATGFRITSFATTNCRTLQHDPPSGDDRGGIAVSATHLFVTGDSATVRMSAVDLSGLASASTVHNGLVTDVETDDVYVLLDASGAQPNGAATITQLGLLDGTTGALTSTRIPLTMSIAVTYGTGIFSGYGEALIGVLSSSTLQWWHIELATGTVTRLGNTQSPTHRTCENWAWWGVAEYFDDTLYATYVASETQIQRLAIPMSGMSSAAPATVSTFSALGDMCSIVFSATHSRWYFHHEYGSQFSATPSGEIAGSCDGTFARL